MQLYVYDHCPYCVRARMIFGLKNLPVEIIYLANDDQKPVELVGKKVVPILIKENGEAMPESLDIVKYIDNQYDQPLLSDNVRPEISQWIEQVSSYYNHLLLPRFVKLDLPEYQTQSALTYFTESKSAYIGSFDENLQKTAEYLERLHQDLAILEKIIKKETALNQDLSLEDIMVFPMLRNITCIKGVQIPAKAQNYITTMAKLSKIDLYTEKAV